MKRPQRTVLAVVDSVQPRRNGILNIAKPGGLTSRRVVDGIARLVRPEKAGHAGTLDPLATGVLVVCVGKSTRLIELIQQQPKTYEAAFLLGCESDTDDVTGTVTDSNGGREITRADVEAVLPSFRGRIQQTPPRFSAVHVGGKRAYELARGGNEVDLAPRAVDVHRLDLARFEHPRFELTIECGSGTYVRAIGRDIGRALGCGAVMSSLVRTRIGPYLLADAIAPDQLTPQNVDQLLLSPVTAVESLPKHRASGDEISLIRAGRSVAAPDSIGFSPGATVAVLDADGQLICLADFNTTTSQLLPRRVFVD